MLERIARGDLPAKHHTQLRGPNRELRYEEPITRGGFDGPYTIAYHLHPPQRQRQVDLQGGWRTPVALPAQRLAKRHCKSFDLPVGGASTEARTPLLFNRDVVLSTLRPDASDTRYFSNGDADDLFYIHEGAGHLLTTFGTLTFEAGDYVFIPRGTTHRFEVDAGVRQYWLSIECLGGMDLLKQWRNGAGQLRMDAPYCHRDFRRPEFAGPVDEGIREVLVKRGGAFHGFSSEESPLDWVGWDGAVYPWVFPILNFQPRVSSVHVPPSWHGTFGTPGALICSFVPRLVDFHPEAIPCPYPHSSVDMDEVLFYCKGNFTSRRGVAPGSISYHPAGIPHGPHPGAYEASIGTTRTDELAVMLDTVEPLTPTAAALGVEDAGYHDSFIP
jgi:homogentisate 1,2-dioxygenase